ncbi:FK506 binding protein [Aureococcus anophagefferens]|nr:FK506 binding protein [Aureococcus anophagefferens]
MSDHHFCPRCGGHIKGERCELCAPDPADRELDASEIHDVSPAADGSLLKQVTTAGEDAGPQQLATPSPLCDVEARLVAVVEDGDEELMRNRGAYSHDDREARRLVQVGEKKRWGNAHFQRGDHGRAIRRYGRAVELGENDDPDDVDEAMLDLLATVRCNRAAAHLKAGDFGAAMADCDAALARDPRNDKAKLRRATALQELGSLDAARDALLDLAARVQRR